jgi:AraC-like DNA-binding protein
MTKERAQRSTDRVTTNAVLFDHLMTGARKNNIDMDRLYADCGVDPHQIHDPGYRISVTTAVNLLHRSRRLLKDEFLGLLGTRMPLGYFRHSVLAVIQQPTLGEALHRYIDFNNVFIESLNLKLVETGKRVEVVMQREASSSIVDNVAIESAMATFHRLAGWLCNELLFLEKVTLDYPKPAYYREYQHLFYGAPTYFDQPCISLAFESRYMGMPVVQNESSAESYIQRAPLDIYLPQDVRGTTSRTVRERLKSSIGKGRSTCELKDIASELGVSTQTVRRRLSKEGTSFNTIRSQLKRDLSINALGNLDLSIEEVALQTGYSEPAAFIRAFGDWTGISPAKFRKLLASRTSDTL